MQRFFLASLLFTGVLASCTPRTNPTAGTTVSPMVIKVSESAPRGGTVTIQGRYLGTANVGVVRLGADVDGKGGYTIPGTAATSWTDSEIVLTIPADAPQGSSWLFIEVNGKQSSNGLPFSVR